MAIKARKAWQVGEYKITVHEGTLYVRQAAEWNSRSPKITIYLKHTGIEHLQMDGYVKITTVNALQGDQFTLKGDGFIKGDLEVDVAQLKVALDGFCTLSISGEGGQI